MIVEPFANDRLEDNLNPLSRILCCFGDGLRSCFDGCQRAALGTQAGEGKIREIMKAGGFRNFRRTTQTPFDQVPVLTIYEARR